MGKNMEALVNNIFMDYNLRNSVTAYFKLLQAIEVEKPSREFTTAVVLLEKNGGITNPQTCNDALLDTFKSFNAALAFENRERLLLCYLAMIICCYYIGDKEAARDIQLIVSKLSFEVSFWEKNCNDIKKMAICVGGLALVVATGGSAVLGAGAAASAYQMLGKDMPSMNVRINRFEEIKKAILAFKFI